MLKTSLTLASLVLTLCAGAQAHSAKASSPQDLADFGITSPTDSSTRVPSDALPVADPSKVALTASEALGQLVVSAGTDTDTVNAGFNHLNEMISNATFFPSSSGLGVLATGRASYDTSGIENPNLILLVQRQAYNRAYLTALVNMRKFLEGAGVKAVSSLEEQLQLLDLGQESLVKSDTNSKERVSTLVNGVVQGAVVYEMVDDPEHGDVLVRLVSTPKTQGAIARTRGDVLNAADLMSGLDAIMRELRNSVVPPSGGRILTTKDGQIAWVGYGSAVCRKNRNANVEKRLRENAVRQANARAEASLVGLLNGEAVEQNYEDEEGLEMSIHQMNVVLDPGGVEMQEPLSQDEISSEAKSLSRRSVTHKRSGELPAGVTFQTYFSEDASWVYSIYVYTEKATQQAQAIAESMTRNSPLKEGRVGSYELNADGSFKRDKEGRLIPRSMGDGRVTQDKDL